MFYQVGRGFFLTTERIVNKIIIFFISAKRFLKDIISKTFHEFVNLSPAPQCPPVETNETGSKPNGCPHTLRCATDHQTFFFYYQRLTLPSRFYFVIY